MRCWWQSDSPTAGMGAALHNKRLAPCTIPVSVYPIHKLFSKSHEKTHNDTECGRRTLTGTY